MIRGSRLSCSVSLSLIRGVAVVTVAMIARCLQALTPSSPGGWPARESLIAVWLARIFSLLGVILVSFWVLKEDTDEKFLGGVAFYDSEKVFNLHPLFMVISILFCMVMSITSFRDGRSFSVSKYLHMGFNLMAKIFMVIGLRSVYVFHDEPNGKGSDVHYRHFNSMHSWLGLCTSFLLFQQDLLGAINYIYPKFFRVHPFVLKYYKSYHMFFGKCAFVMGGAAMLTGTY